MLDRILGEIFSHNIGIRPRYHQRAHHVRDRGIVMSEPLVVAIDAKTRRVLAVGAEAKRMVGRTPADVIAVRPLRDGVISDFDVTEADDQVLRGQGPRPGRHAGPAADVLGAVHRA